MRPWSNPKVVAKTPLVTTLLLEGANVGQMWRMWTERTAAGQSLVAWLSVCVALVLWLHFFRTCTPDQKTAIRASKIGIVMNLCVVASVVYFRYVV